MRELEHELRALAADPPFPPTPDIAGAVRARLAGEPAGPPRAVGPLRRRPVPPLRRPLGSPLRPRPVPPLRRPLASPLRWPLAAQAAAALLAIFVALMAASPGVRSAVLEALGIQGARIERREPSPRARAAGDRLELGRSVTLAQARRLAPFDVVVPRDPGPPDAVRWDGAAPGGGQLAFLWRGDRPRPLLLTQIAALPEPVVGKAAGPRTRIEELMVDGEPGFWLSGPPHEFGFLSTDGRFHTERLRLAGDTLIWNRDGVLLRLEGAPSKRRALQIARSVR
jgi:hypothetical protein